MKLTVGLDYPRRFKPGVLHCCTELLNDFLHIRLSDRWLAARFNPPRQPVLNLGFQPADGTAAQAHWLGESPLGNTEIDGGPRKSGAFLDLRKP